MLLLGLAALALVLLWKINEDWQQAREKEWEVRIEKIFLERNK